MAGAINPTNTIHITYDTFNSPGNITPTAFTQSYTFTDYNEPAQTWSPTAFSAVSGSLIVSKSGGGGYSVSHSADVITDHRYSNFNFRIYDDLGQDLININANNTRTAYSTPKSGQTGIVRLASGSRVYFELIRTNLDYVSSSDDIMKPYFLGEGQASLGNYSIDVAISKSEGQYISSVLGNRLCLTSSLANLYTSSIGYTFNPSLPIESLLYPQYGVVSETFKTASIYDVLVVNHIPSGSVLARSKAYNIVTASALTSPTYSLCFECDEAFGEETVNNIQYVLILRRFKDESSIILNFDKESPRTSYGLVIPHNLSDEVLDNIDIITKELKTKLLEINNV